MLSYFNKKTMRSEGDFVNSYTLEQRKEESSRIILKYPTKLPVIVEKGKNNNTDIPNIDKHKYLVPSDMTIGQFVFVIRKRIKLEPEKGLFIFINNMLPPTSMLMSSIYSANKAPDGFLYVSYSGESTFG